MKSATILLSNEVGDNWNIEVFRANNDYYGNPRYIVHYLDLGLSDWKSSKLTRSVGLKLYRGKDFGGGFIFQDHSGGYKIRWIMEELRSNKI